MFQTARVVCWSMLPVLRWCDRTCWFMLERWLKSRALNSQLREPGFETLGMYFSVCFAAVHSAV